LPEAVVLSTCERLEIYGVGAPDVAAAFLQQALGMGFPLALTRWTGSTAVRHLFRVVAGWIPPRWASRRSSDRCGKP